MSKNKELKLGVDEFTIILSTSSSFEDIFSWSDIAGEIVQEVLKLARLEDIFGEFLQAESKKQQGYSKCFAPESPMHIQTGYHPLHPNMQVFLKFSAWAWAFYQSEYVRLFSQPMDIVNFLNLIQSPKYSTKFSRIDLTADFKNYDDFDLNQLYADCKSEKIIAQNHEGKKSARKLTAIENQGEVNTIYFGHKGVGTRSFLRVYNKKIQVEATKGFQLKESVSSDSWVRCEAVFKGIYAHQIHDFLLNEVSTPKELEMFIASKILNRYAFFDTEKGDVTDFTKDLQEIAKGSNFSNLRSENPRDHSLAQKLNHLVTDSGLMSCAYYAYALFGDSGRSEFWSLLQKACSEYKPSRENTAYLKKHRSLLLKQTLKEHFVL